MNPEQQSRPAKCPCQHCGGMIEFDSDAAGQGGDCPHCGKRTWIDLPEKFMFMVKPKVVPENTLKPKPEPDQYGGGISRKRVKAIAQLFGAITLLCMLWSGYLSIVPDEEKALTAKADEAQEKEDSADLRVNEAIEQGSNNYKQFSEASYHWFSEKINYRSQAHYLRDRRSSASNGFFYLGLGACLLWVPAGIYLFLVPKQPK